MKPIINHIDGYLYVAMAVCTTAVAELSTADAVELVSKLWLFIFKTIFEILGAAALAGKTYRSTTFGKKQEQDQAASGAPQAVPLVATMQPTNVETVVTTSSEQFPKPGIMPSNGGK